VTLLKKVFVTAETLRTPNFIRGLAIVLNFYGVLFSLRSLRLGGKLVL